MMNWIRIENLRRLRDDILEAIRGSQQDFTEGSLGRAILLLSIPMALEMLMESVFAVVDVYFVARLGAEAVASVGLTESLLTLVFAVGIGLSMATTAMVARRVGEKKIDSAAAAAGQAILLGFFVALPIGLAGIVWGSDLLRLMGASEGVLRTGSGYTMVMLGGNLSIMLLFLINAIFRGAGDAAMAMRVLWLGNLCNLLLDPCLIFGLGPFPELGVTGAAVATTIGRSVAVLYQFTVLFLGRSRIRLRPGDLRFVPSTMLHLLRISVGGIGQFLVQTASWIGLVRIISIFGSDALAGYTISIRVIVFAILPSWGIANAAATLVGQNLGALKPARAEKAVWITSFSNMFVLVGVALFFILAAEPLIAIFTRDAAIVAYAVDCLRYISYGYGFYAFGMVAVQAFNGAGDTMTPTMINLFCYWLFQIPLAYVLALPLGGGARGVFLAITISESVAAVVSVLVFRRGRWKGQKV